MGRTPGRGRRFAVNVAGAFLVGWLFASFRDHPPERLHHPFFATGICGTLTTFSTFLAGGSTTSRSTIEET